MRKVKDSNEVEQATETVAFELKLPAELSIAPWVEVELPRNKKALVYQVSYIHKDFNTKQTRYDVYVVSRKSMKSATELYHRSSHFEDLPAVKHFLYDTAALLSVRKTTRKIVNVQDVQEVDDD